MCNNCARHFGDSIDHCEWEDDPPATSSSGATLPSLPEIPKNRGRLTSPPRLEDLGYQLLDPFETYPSSEVQDVDRLLRFCETAKKSVALALLTKILMVVPQTSHGSYTSASLSLIVRPSSRPIGLLLVKMLSCSRSSFTPASHMIRSHSSQAEARN